MRRCDQPGCLEAGVFRAPRDRSLRHYYWFCLAHVRAYNAAWDYYKGMSPTEIEQALRADVIWQRPSWPLGRVGGAIRLPEAELHDPLGVLREGAGRRRRTPPTRQPMPPAELRPALALLGLGWPLDEATLRARYKELAKRHHPDVTGGDRHAEERLKDINRAYALLRRSLRRQRHDAVASGPAG